MDAASKSDQVLEAIFSLLRWYFLIMSLWIYQAYYHTAQNVTFFWILFGAGALYMGVAQYVLHRTEVGSKVYIAVTRGGILFDLVAVIALMAVTGWTGSPMFPISYLIILHASVYWGLRGGVVTAVLLVLGYALAWLLGSDALPTVSPPFHAMNLIILISVGAIGGLIISRERKHMKEKYVFEHLAKRDYITGLYNHRVFQDDLRQSIQRRRPFTLVMADIDYFKSINDRFGHTVGDEVLASVANVLEWSNPELEGVSYRYGGEEFAIILYTGSGTSSEALVEELRAKIANLTFRAADTTFSVTMSFGLVTCEGQYPEELVKLADQALYRAKQEGRNRVCSFLAIPNYVSQPS